MAYDTLPDRVRAIANLSDFSRRSGIPRRTLVRLAEGKRRPSLETCERISEALRTIRPAKKAKPPDPQPLGELQAAA